ncbi:MAG: hypothetical protein IKJ88_09670 [Clostridia bacterium]|nr:hypothetical protein [Clostridia bacterium]
MYYTQEEDLARDAKKTELEFARARAFVARLKAAFINGKLPIARMVSMVFIISCLLIPFGTVSMHLPFFSKDITLSALGFYGLFSNGLLAHVFELPVIGVASDVFIFEIAAAAAYILMVLTGVAIFAVWLLSFINLRKSSKALAGLSLAAIIFDIITAVLMLSAVICAKQYTVISASFGAGSIVALIAFGVFMFINIKMYKENAQVTVKEVDLKRIEIAKKVKSGEIKLEDLPMPIFETEEEKQARINAFGKEKKGEKKND